MFIEYLPQFLQNFYEYQEIGKSIDSENILIENKIDNLILESSILNCSIKRLEEWEQFLNIIPNGEEWQRKDFVIATLRGQGKLNTDKINNIVNAFTGGTSISSFANSTINVKILPPPKGDIFIFTDVERALNRLKPAHVRLLVERYYSTWNDVKTNLNNWTAVSLLKDWQELKDKLYIQ